MQLVAQHCQHLGFLLFYRDFSNPQSLGYFGIPEPLYKAHSEYYTILLWQCLYCLVEHIQCLLFKNRHIKVGRCLLYNP